MPDVTDELTQVLADARGEAAVLRRRGHVHEADAIEELCTKVQKAAEDFLTFVAETDARLATGRSVDYLRSHFAEWERQGHAFKRGRIRYYRLLVLPRRADVQAARAAGRRGEALDRAS